MGFIKFLFVLVILIPIAIVMFFLISKLLDEVSGNADKSKRNKSSHNSYSGYNNENGYYPEYMNGNTQYDTYRQKRSKYVKAAEQYKKPESAAGRQTDRSRVTSDPLSRRKKRKERKHKKNSKV